MEFPPDKETMRSFLGMINYLKRYSALSGHLVAPLSALTHQVTDYKPGKVHLENLTTEDGNFQYEGTSILQHQC